jgi:hypothetical protein
MSETMQRLVAPSAAAPMSETMERLVAPSDAALETDVRTPVLITAGEVAFGTAAAVPLRPAAGWPARAVASVLAVYQTFAGSEERRQPRHHPKRLRYLEDARMGREMDRL